MGEGKEDLLFEFAVFMNHSYNRAQQKPQQNGSRAILPNPCFPILLLTIICAIYITHPYNASTPNRALAPT